MINDSSDRTLPFSDAELIDVVRDDFQQAWKAGATLRIEDFLHRVGDNLRSAAFRELLKIEIKLRRNRNEQCAPEDYLGRFPSFEADVRETFRRSVQNATIRADMRSGPRCGLHVRCPHCHNPIELMPDAELESLRCDSCGSDFSLTGDTDQATRDARGLAQLGHFKLVERLGMGTFGTVWKAQDVELDRTVAVKIPRRGQLNKLQQDFFLREARSAAQLHHPNIVPVHEVGREGETLYIVSDFVRGIDLSDWLTGQQPTARDAVELCTRIADALDHAHQHGVVHRDLKPANIMIDGDGEPHLMDFGLARRDVGELTMTLDGQVIGTPAYMSPEQAMGESHKADQRSDLYSLGVILFQLLTGELPFRGNARMLMHQVVNDEPPTPRKLNASIPCDLETITLKCLGKKPDKRYQTARELREDLQRFLRNEPILARPTSHIERLVRWTKRKPALAAVGALVIMLAIGGPLTAISFARQKRQLENLVQERNSLLSNYDRQLAAKVSEVGRLREDLALWEGKADPETVWPPQPLDKTRQKLLVELFASSLDKLASDLRDAHHADPLAAMGHIGVAHAADELDQHDLARRQWAAAAERLAALTAAEPGNRAYARALADCHVQLARLASPDNRRSAIEHLQQAGAIQQSLDRGEGPFPQIALFEVESARASLGGYDEAKRMTLAFKALQTADRRWMLDPALLYRVTGYLVGQQPLLLVDSPSDPAE